MACVGYCVRSYVVAPVIGLQPGSDVGQIEDVARKHESSP